MVWKMEKLVWAVDPYTDLETLWTRVNEFLTVLVRESPQLVVQPVYVIGPVGLNWVGQIAVPQVEKFIEVAQKATEQVLAKVRIPNMKPADVIVNHRLSRRWDVEELLAYADRERADSILLTTHARRGPQRVLLGSFSETALLHSHKPLFVINPETAAINSMRRILFPTDFSIGSKKSLDRLLALMNGGGHEVIIYNKVTHPIDAFVESGVAIAGGGWVSVEEFLRVEKGTRFKEAEKLEAVIKNRGSAAKCVIDDSPGSVVDGILGAIKEYGVDLVALGSEAGPISAVLLGSVSRNIVRQSTVPAWVLHNDES